MSSTVGSRCSRSGFSNSLTGANATCAARRLLAGGSVDGHDLRELVDARLHAGGDGVLVAEEPDVVVQRLARVVVLEPGLHAGQVVLQGRRKRASLAGHEEWGVHAVATERRGGRGVGRTGRVGERVVAAWLLGAPAEALGGELRER